MEHENNREAIIKEYFILLYTAEQSVIFRL